MPTTLVAGATGYLGRFIVAELHARGHTVRAIARNQARAERAGHAGAPALAGLVDEWMLGDVTDATFVADVAKGADLVISALGVTRQRADPWEIDNEANLAILRSAMRHGAESFCYVNALDADQCDAPITRAKTAFAQTLAASKMRSQIMNPSGYFSDVLEVFTMAKASRVFAISPRSRINPIHGADLAVACADRLEAREPGSWSVGGPDVFTWAGLGHAAFRALEQRPRFARIPPGAVTPAIRLVSLFSPRLGGLVRFMTWGMQRDNVGEPTGTHRVTDFFAEHAAAAR